MSGLARPTKQVKFQKPPGQVLFAVKFVNSWTSSGLTEKRKEHA